MQQNVKINLPKKATNNETYIAQICEDYGGEIERARATPHWR